MSYGIKHENEVQGLTRQGAVVQHTMTVRINKQQVVINCPPYLSPEALDVMLMCYRTEHPDHKIISRSWRSHAPIQSQ